MPVQMIHIPAAEKMTANLHARCEESANALWGRLLKMSWRDLSEIADYEKYDITVDVFVPMTLRPNGTFYAGKCVLIGEDANLMDLFHERRAVSIKNAFGERRKALFKMAVAEHWYQVFGRRVATWALGERPLAPLNDDELREVEGMTPMDPCPAEALSGEWRAHHAMHGARAQVFSAEAVERERKHREGESAHTKIERAMARKSSPLLSIDPAPAEKAPEEPQPMDLMDIIAGLSARP